MYQQFNTPSVRTFINEHLYSDVRTLALKKTPFSDVSMQKLLFQIEGKRKAKEKIPSFFQIDDIIYPPTVSMEQCSSEQTASYKATLCGGNQLIDLTGGFGVDTWMFSKKFNEVIYCEKNEELVNIARHNFSILHLQNIVIQHGNGIDFLKHQNRTFDWIYIDPSRRDQHNRKMHSFSDCTPDVVENLDSLFQYGERIILKSSPMLDIEKAISELKQVEAIHIVAVKNEVREVLYLLKKTHQTPIITTAVNICPDKTQSFSFSKEKLQNTKVTFSMPLTFLYEPNAAVMKSGAFNLVSEQFNISKLHKNSHLYTSEHYISNFPGKIFKIKEVMAYKPVKDLSQVNISVRNFPDTPDKVRKKLNLRDGGNIFLFCTTLINEKPMIIYCEKEDI